MTHRGWERRRALGRLAVAAVLALASGVSLPACGGDDDPVATTPTATGPTGPEESQGSEDSAGNEPKPGGGSGEPDADTPTGGEPAPPDSETPGPPASEDDTEEHDVPPPPGSPAEQFEQECEAHPEICE
jgi:hypothetical protein